ncbi:hypothetical protein GQ44DRAFT_706986 [Phaeosphaeriaceae sp. PMI808]|nr:hypothetical protein GQ44DRAFT_706986 [Phaeosphaeriaceae sp. PMI808]
MPLDLTQTLPTLSPLLCTPYSCVQPTVLYLMLLSMCPYYLYKLQYDCASILPLVFVTGVASAWLFSYAPVLNNITINNINTLILLVLLQQ